MDAERWKRTRDLFEQALEIAADAREDWLREACGGDEALHAAVVRMLAADSDHLGMPTAALAGRAPELLGSLADEIEQRAQQALIGSRIGPYRVLSELGHGGMGSVYLAERADGEFEQQVALKLVRPGWDVDEMLLRFRAERQILASLNHPNISRLLDGGVTGDGKPWLVLEYIDGLSLTRWCDQNALSLTDRLSLFVTVCEAVAHAHDRLVVHRDLKPSNIMVSREGQVKLLDFGVAKLLGEDRGLSMTRPGVRILTPEYASPEQIRGEVITIASDIYALGLLLFELLTGRKPYRVVNLSAQAWERAILEQEPSRPSLRVSQPTPEIEDTDSPTSEEIARRRQLDPEHLRRELSGDLDAIILKALRKDPRDRYLGVRELAEDIRAHLEHRPVSARRGSTRYRIQRFLRRLALAASLAALAVLGLVGGTAVSLWQAREARVQRDLALDQAGKSAALRDFMLDVFRRSDPARSAGREMSARDLLDEAVARIPRMRLRDPATQAELLQAMAEAYQAIGADEMSNRLLTRVLELRMPILDDERIEADVHILLGRTWHGLGDADKALAEFARAEALLATDRDDAVWARLWMARGITEMSLGKLEDAVRNLERGSDGLAAALGETDDTTVSARAVLSWMYDELERYDDIERVIAPLLVRLRADPDANPVRLADLLDAWANALQGQGRMDEAVDSVREALEITRRVYGDTHRHAGSRWNNLAFALLGAQRLGEAAQAMQQALEISRQHYPPGTHRIGSETSNLARIEMELGQWDAAEAHILEGIAIREKPEDKTDLAYSLVTAAGIARGSGRSTLAAERLERARHWFDAMPNKPAQLRARLELEQAEQDLSDPSRQSCPSAEPMLELHRAAPLSANAANLAWAEFIATACAARGGDTAAGSQLEDRRRKALDLLAPESIRREWSETYMARGGEEHR